MDVFTAALPNLSCGKPGLGLPAVPADPNGPSAYNFLTFDKTTDELLGATHMIRADLYHGQPCPQLGGLYTFNPLNGYYRCEGLLKREARAGSLTAARSEHFYTSPTSEPAWEMGQVSLEQALQLVIPYAEQGEPRFERAAVRWLGWLFLEEPMPFALAVLC